MIKKAQLALSITHFDKKLTINAFGAFCKHITLSKNHKSQSEASGQRLVHQSLLAWRSLFKKKSMQKLALKGLIHRKSLEEKSTFFNVWKKDYGFFRVLSSLYSVFDMGKNQSKEYFVQI
jgi:hypothetical protein